MGQTGPLLVPLDDGETRLLCGTRESLSPRAHALRLSRWGHRWRPIFLSLTLWGWWRSSMDLSVNVSTSKVGLPSPRTSHHTTTLPDRGPEGVSLTHRRVHPHFFVSVPPGPETPLPRALRHRLAQTSRTSGSMTLPRSCWSESGLFSPEPDSLSCTPPAHTPDPPSWTDSVRTTGYPRPGTGPSGPPRAPGGHPDPPEPK